MPRKTVITDYEVRIAVRPGWLAQTEEERLKTKKRNAESIVSAINRHIDDVQQAWVHAETEAVCSFCGWAWTEAKDSPHNGGCCGEDCEIMEAIDANTAEHEPAQGEE